MTRPSGEWLSNARACGTLAVALCALLLGGCGGGGADGATGGSGGGGLATVSLTSRQVSLQGDTSVDGVPSADIQLAFSGSTTPTYYLSYTFGGTAVREVQQVSGGGIPDNTIRILLYRPGQLGAGTYTDAVQLQVCADSACSRQFPGSPATIAVTYTVTGSATPTTTFSLGASVWKFTASTTDATPPSANWVLTVYDLPRAGIYGRWTPPSGPAIADISFQMSQCSLNCVGPDWGTFTVTMKPPGPMAPGVYSDSVTFEFCFDAACTNPLPGSPVTVAVQYVVYASAGKEYTRRVVSIGAVDVAWNATDGMLYAITAPTGAQPQGTITRVDPVTAQPGAALTLAGNPTRLSLSDDGQFAYVNLPELFEIQRVRLADLSSDLVIPMGVNGSGAQVKAARMAVAPGAPHTLAVALQTTNGSEAGGVAVFDDAVPRPQALAPLDREFFDSLAWSPDGSSLYLLRSAYPPSLYNLDTVTVAPAGLGIASVRSDFMAQTGYWQYSDFFYDGGRIYTIDGQVFDAATGNKLGAFALPQNASANLTLAADASLGRTYFIYYDSPTGQTQLQVFDQATWAPINLTNLYDPVYSNMHLIRWGTDGLAFSNSSSIVLLNGSFVAP